MSNERWVTAIPCASGCHVRIVIGEEQREISSVAMTMEDAATMAHEILSAAPAELLMRLMRKLEDDDDRKIGAAVDRVMPRRRRRGQRWHS
jgi:hypothetical protein